MSTVQRRTQTAEHDSSEYQSPGVVPRLTRFLRADDPFEEVVSYSLARHPRWELGRVDHPPSVWPEGRIVTVSDVAMSSRHAVIEARAGRYVISDARSKNGTFLNGHRLQGEHSLEHGDIIECGRCFFSYRETRRSSLTPHVHPDGLLDVVPLEYQILPVAPYLASDLALHLYGETGTGKEIVARAVHALSGKRGRFVAVNCAAIPEHLFESEMFGHRKGAFSGATEAQRGAIAAAHEGTLFLDEIAELTLPQQAKLLRVLETKQVTPLGGHTSVPADFRLISATLSDLRELVACGRFRPDLYARLGQFITIAPLREHREELGTLIQNCLAARLAERGRERGFDLRVCFSIEAARALVAYSFPHNIRELRQVIDGAWMRASADPQQHADRCVIELRHLATNVAQQASEVAQGLASRRAAAAGKAARESAKEGELHGVEPRTDIVGEATISDEQLLEVLREVDGNRASAAKLLGVCERTVYRRLQRLRSRALETDS